MNDKNRQRHIAYEVLVILGQLALLTYITRLWPILLLVILGIFIAALRLLFLSSQKVEPIRPLPTLPPPRQPPTEKDLQSAAYTIIQCRITQIQTIFQTRSQDFPSVCCWMNRVPCPAVIAAPMRGRQPLSSMISANP